MFVLFPEMSMYSTIQVFGLSISIYVSGIDKQPSSYVDLSLPKDFTTGFIKQRGFFFHLSLKHQLQSFFSKHQLEQQLDLFRYFCT